ncbi:GGDEF domain-containing protein [Bordetella holmesii]|uniref:GGDEF domain-containing protein n=1 Tax=Bordetella holmesii TaxID=35814 RepID=UPI001298742A|nr:GGDEF domain-containing protein [Bordetella holmesii]QGE90463.1 diguanylate cyclase [Bordetella holmesii]
MKLHTDMFVARWKKICAPYPAEVIHLALERIDRQAGELATAFYETMLADEAAAYFLSDQLVHQKLHASLQSWLRTVFGAAVHHDYASAVTFQQRVGEVHARIDIPFYLVMQGTRMLINHLRAGVAHDDDVPQTLRWPLADYLGEIMLFSIEMMSLAYANSHDRNARAEEGYRLLSLSQNVGTEKERQRAALLDWENQLLFGLSVGDSRAMLPRLRKSEFGLWFTHKAAHAFEGAQETTQARLQIEAIDRLLDESDDPQDRLRLLHAVREATRTLAYLVDALFEKANHLDSGRDTLTHLLNRKFLHVVMSKEVSYARKTDSPLSVLMVDIDYFKTVNDEYGHDAGDVVLQQVAALVSTYSRGGDYTFRLGGEEFLVVLVDADSTQAQHVAENLRQRLQDKALLLPDGSQKRVTMSVGVATHDGHPDYQRLLKRADDALYAAKARGRNTCVLAD